MTRDELRDAIAELLWNAPLGTDGTCGHATADKVLDLVYNAGKLPTSVATDKEIGLNDRPPAHPVANEIKRQIAKGIADRLPPGVGFCLFTFTFDAGWVDYMSNADRGDMIRMIEGMLAIWKKGKMGART